MVAKTRRSTTAVDAAKGSPLNFAGTFIRTVYDGISGIVLAMSGSRSRKGSSDGWVNGIV